MTCGAPKCATGSQLAGIGREQAINQAVKNLGIMTLVIAHRESTVAIAGKRVELRRRNLDVLQT